MRSSQAKVLHEIAGKPLLVHVLETARRLEPSRVHVVVGADGGDIRARCGDGSDLNWIEQTEQLGTGHATAQAIPQVADGATVLVLYGDVPLANREVHWGNACERGRGRQLHRGCHGGRRRPGWLGPGAPQR